MPDSTVTPMVPKTVTLPLVACTSTSPVTARALTPFAASSRTADVEAFRTTAPFATISTSFVVDSTRTPVPPVIWTSLFELPFETILTLPSVASMVRPFEPLSVAVPDVDVRFKRPAAVA